jgi:hypothetical protein
MGTVTSQYGVKELNNRVPFNLHFGIDGAESEGIVLRSQPIAYAGDNA